MKKLISLLAAILLLITMSVGALAAPETETPYTEYIGAELLPPEAEANGEDDADIAIDDYITDNAGLFNDDEKIAMFEKIRTIRKNYKFDIVIHTTRSLDGKEPKDYNEDYFTANECGYGADRNGLVVMLCISDETGRDVYITAHGPVGKSVFDSYYTLDFDNGPVFGKMLPILKEDRYYDAEMAFLDCAERLLASDAENNNGSGADDNSGGDSDYGDYDYDGSSHPTTYILKSEAIAVAVGCAVALVIVLLLKRTMKTNRIQHSANNYEKPGSMRITYADERFVRTTVDRRAKPKDDGKDHDSDSGGGFSGGGGSF